MLNERVVNVLWNKVVIPTFKETREVNSKVGTPTATARKICHEIGTDAAMEVFATIAKIKKHDGRIYGKNREIMNATETNPKANYTMIRGLDEIHTTHIDQIITEIIKLNEEGRFK